MIAAGERPSFARSGFAGCAAWLLAGAFVLTLAPAAAQQPSPPPAARATPAKPKPSSQTPEDVKKETVKPASPKPAQKQPGAPGMMTQPPEPAPAPPIAPITPAPPHPLPPLPPLDTSKPPPLLPRASRERMRACADQWNVMKRRSNVGLPTWREFASGCLTRPSSAPQENAPGAAHP